nr:uncharacterized protein LOC127492593 isoform X3 [Oryctolagus cuniculus]
MAPADERLGWQLQVASWAESRGCCLHCFTLSTAVDGGLYTPTRLWGLSSRFWILETAAACGVPVNVSSQLPVLIQKWTPRQTAPGGRKLVADSGLRTFMLCAQGAWGCSLLCSWALEASFGIPDAETAIAPLCLQCPRLAPVPGLRCPRTTGSRLQLAVSVSSELKSWPRRVLAEVLLAGHFTICAAPGASGVRAGPASPPLCEAPTAGFLGAWAWASRDTTQEHLPARLYPVPTPGTCPRPAPPPDHCNGRLDIECWAYFE